MFRPWRQWKVTNYYFTRELVNNIICKPNVKRLMSDSSTLPLSKGSTPNEPQKINFFLPTDILFESADLSILSREEKEKVDSPARPFVDQKFVEACQKEIDEGHSYTENNAKTYNTSGNPVVDFFFHIMEQTSQENTIDLLEKSWAFNPEDTIKLIANLRDIRGGKSIRYQSMICFYWLYKNHPITLYNNLENVPEIGYWKDLLHIMMAILFDGYVGEYLKFDDCPDVSYRRRSLEERKRLNNIRGKIYNDLVAKYFKVESKSLSRHERGELRRKYGKHKFSTDPKYRLFHLKIAQLFADQLKRDRKLLDDDKMNCIGLCGKWTPTDSKHFDKFSLIKTSISVKLLDDNHQILKDYKTFTEGLTESDRLTQCQSTFAYLARKECHKKYETPLRIACKMPELYFYPDKWCLVDYKRVASKCMMKNKESFIKHDKERFETFISESKKVSGATIKPVELIQEILTQHDPLCREIYEKQWISIVESLKGKGSLLESALSICDVSGSMYGIPLNAALGLTLLTSQLSKPPWSSLCMTFSRIPQFHEINQDTLYEKLIHMQRMQWNMDTNIDAAFELILNTAIKHKLKSEDLPKIIFLFTDMEFNQCVESNKTNFEYIKGRFDENEYKLPTVVFWNLRSSGRNSTPIKSNESGFILISGYSPKLLSFIMKCKDISEMNPVNTVKQILMKYDKFKVYD